MHPPFAPPRYQPSPLQSLFHPGVAQLNPVLLAQLLVKMLHVQIEIAISIQSQNLLHRGQRDPFGGRLSPPSVEQTVIAVRFVALVPASHRPIADADNLGCLPPGNLLCHGPQNHFLYFHRPLHRGLRVRLHAWHGLLLSPPEKRTLHLLSQPDISCATDKDGLGQLTCQPLAHMIPVSRTMIVALRDLGASA